MTWCVAAILGGAVAGSIPQGKSAESRTLTYATRDGTDLVLDLYLPATPIRRPRPVGTSAGGHLAAVAALAPRGTFDGTDNLDRSSAVRCVLDAYGPTQFDVMDAQTLQEKASLQSPVVAIAVGGGRAEAGKGAPPRRDRAHPLQDAAGVLSRMTMRHLPNRG